MKRRIFEAGLLYGKIDTSAAGPGVPKFISSALFRTEMSPDNETWEVLDARWQQSPFRRYARDTGGFGEFTLELDKVRNAPLIPMDADAVPEPVISAVERYLRRVGYVRIDGMDIRKYSQTLRDLPWPPVAGMDSLDAAVATTFGPRSIMAAMGVHAAVERSVEQGVPFYSRDDLAPAWIQTADASPQFAVVRAALDIPDGPTLPTSIKALERMVSDARVTKFRDFVSWATNRVLTADSTAVREVQNEVQRASARRRQIRSLETITRLVTYVSLPIGAAEVLIGASGPGLAFASAGFLAEGCASILKRFDKRHWMTL